MKTAFCTFVYGKYYRYIPYYIYAIRQSYPEAAIIILYDGILPKSYKTIVNHTSNCILEESFVKGHDWAKMLKHRGAKYQSIRHMLIRDVFFDYDYIYFGDVDIMILKESYDLFDFHKQQSKKSQLPFSNKIRPLENNKTIPSNRLTGLHWVEVKPYFLKLRPVIQRFLNDSEYRAKLLEGTVRNEQVLYNLCEAAFNFDPAVLFINKRPWHGFHLGVVRGQTFLNKATIIQNSSLNLEDLKSQLEALNKTGAITKLLMSYYCYQVYQTFTYLGIDLPFKVIFKYKVTQVKRKLIHNLKYR